MPDLKVLLLHVSEILSLAFTRNYALVTQILTTPGAILCWDHLSPLGHPAGNTNSGTTHSIRMASCYWIPLKPNLLWLLPLSLAIPQSESWIHQIPYHTPVG